LRAPPDGRAFYCSDVIETSDVYRSALQPGVWVYQLRVQGSAPYVIKAPGPKVLNAHRAAIERCRSTNGSFTVQRTWHAPLWPTTRGVTFSQTLAMNMQDMAIHPPADGGMK
jgi:hypothetical protein